MTERADKIKERCSLKKTKDGYAATVKNEYGGQIKITHTSYEEMKIMLFNACSSMVERMYSDELEAFCKVFPDEDPFIENRGMFAK